MLGITLADAIAVSTLIIAVLAAWRGAKQGQDQKGKNPPDNQFVLAGAAFADTAALQAHTAATIRLAEAIEAIVSMIAQERSDDIKDLRSMVEQLLHSKTSRR